MTEAELKLWLWLRKPGIAGLRFRRQVPIGRYIVDFFCPQRRLIVEVDGGQHGSEEDAAHDRARDAWLAEQGYRVVRVWNNDVMENIDGVCAAIVGPRESDAARRTPPSRNAFGISTSPPRGGWVVTYARRTTRRGWPGQARP